MGYSASNSDLSSWRRFESCPLRCTTLSHRVHAPPEIVLRHALAPSRLGLRCRRGHDRGLRALVRGHQVRPCLLYTSDAADEEDSVDLGGRRIIKKKKKKK